MSYEEWRQHVNHAAYNMVGLVLADLEPYPVEMLYQQKLTPHEAAMVVIQHDSLGRQILKLQALDAAEIHDLDS